jgi:hypothetical protein
MKGKRKKQNKYSRDELLTPELRQYAKKVRKEVKDWQKRKPTEEDIAMARKLIEYASDADVPEDLSENFRFYLYRPESHGKSKSTKLKRRDKNR